MNTVDTENQRLVRRSSVCRGSAPRFSARCRRAILACMLGCVTPLAIVGPTAVSQGPVIGGSGSTPVLGPEFDLTFGGQQPPPPSFTWPYMPLFVPTFTVWNNLPAEPSLGLPAPTPANDLPTGQDASSGSDETKGKGSSKKMDKAAFLEFCIGKGIVDPRTLIAMAALHDWAERTDFDPRRVRRVTRR